MNPNILIIEDDAEIGELVCEYLTQNHIFTSLANTASAGLKQAKQRAFDLIILDIMLPDGDGLDLCRQIRTFSQTPIIMLTAKGEPTDRVLGLELGADDYLTKPFEPRELLARIRAILRREQLNRNKPHDDAHILNFGRLKLLTQSQQVELDSKLISLTSHQYDVLLALAKHVGKVMSREQIMHATSGNIYDNDSFERAIDVHISRIRAAIEDDPKHPKRIITVRGSGYMFAKAQN